MDFVVMRYFRGHIFLGVREETSSIQTTAPRRADDVACLEPKLLGEELPLQLQGVGGALEGPGGLGGGDVAG